MCNDRNAAINCETLRDSGNTRDYDVLIAGLVLHYVKLNEAGECRAVCLQRNLPTGIMLDVDKIYVISKEFNARADVFKGPYRRVLSLSLSGGFTPCRHLRPSSGREHTIV